MRQGVKEKSDTEFSAVIFDLDGLVLDTEITYFWAWKKASDKMGYKLSDDFCFSLSGMHYQHIEQKLLKALGADFDLNQFSQLSGEYWRQYVNQQGIPVKKGFFVFLEQLNSKQIPFCLATNSSQKNAIECLQLAGLDDVFSTIVSAEHVKQGKPAADIFLLAAKILTTSISQCLVLEDSSIGIQAAVKAEAISVYIPPVHTFEFATAEMADFFFNDLAECHNFFRGKHSSCIILPDYL